VDTDRLAQIQELDRLHYVHPFTNHPAMHRQGTFVITGAQGSHVIDEQGRKLIDGLAGLWCVNIGYGRIELIDAICTQLRRLAFYPSFFNTTTEAPVKLAAKLASLLPPTLSHVMFCSSGTEANETAIKIARAYWIAHGEPQRTKMLSRTFSYHGVGVATTSLTGLPSCNDPFGLPLDGFVRVPGPYAYEAGRKDDAAAYADWCIEETERIIQAEDPKTIGALFAEPIQGAGGVIIPPKGYLNKLRALCKRYDILFVADEVITGFGRIGSWFASTKSTLIDSPLEPDMITMAKGLTSGYLPLGAVALSTEVNDTLNRAGYFAHGYTYSGHPVAAAAAFANIEVIERENLVARVETDIGPYFENGLRSLSDHPAVGEVRVEKLIGAIELLPRGGAVELTSALNLGVKLFELARKNGVIVRGIRNLAAVAPPFVITRAEVDKLVATVRKSLDQLWE
jgi:putrescine---pyruvate transaminase